MGEKSFQKFFEMKISKKGVMVSGTHIELRTVHALNETTFLVTYSSGILVEEIGSAIQKIDEWLGKPVVISFDEVTTAQLPQAIECVHHTMGLESILFNTRFDDMQSDSNQSVQSGYHGYAGSPVVPGASNTTFLNKMPGIPWFSGTERERRTLSGLNSGFLLFLMPGKTSMISR